MLEGPGATSGARAGRLPVAGTHTRAWPHCESHRSLAIPAAALEASRPDVRTFGGGRLRPRAARTAAAPCLPAKLASVENADDDAKLMLRYAAGDARAFDLLYARHRAPLWRYVARQLAGASAAADVFQETWSRVIAHRSRYAPDAPFGTWLYRIAHNCCVDHWRAQGRRAQREVQAADEVIESWGDPAAGPLEDALADDDGRRLEAALARLPAEQRGAFLLHVQAGLSVEQIGAATGVGTETAKSRLRYAVARLKRVLGTEPKEQT